jgi:hypothetical protein
VKEITQQHTRNCKRKNQEQGVKLTENKTTYSTDDEDDDETVEHRKHTSIAVT